ncbi:hypothetical protein PMIN06_001956 [Paraphaeosphaeria minitans]|uniref:C6 transcription factor n=1 Tax=Paraphaeosphaeria minitans TaxID=565426 RepID=A0A9P6GNE8_9PLEO|nr:C6 transcription factor [Paraphaeosphaeria minitans]
MPVPMMYDYTEETPLLVNGDETARRNPKDIHLQFCALAGVPPSNMPKPTSTSPAARRSLYGRAVHKRNVQDRTYMFTAALTNTLLLSQVVLGAALTGLGASASSHILITVFGALNTIIAGLVAYLKSRGQPMRARMYRDDLERVVDEMENSEVMWLGIQARAHGYDEIAIDGEVSVRSEVARLTRLYDKVVRNNTMNDPDMYTNATTDAANATLRARPALEAPVANAPAAGAVDGTAPIGVVVPPTATPDDPDAAPASRPPKSKTPPPPPPPAKDQVKEDTEGGAESTVGESGEGFLANGDAVKE